MSRPSIAIIGSTGRLGSAVARELTPDFRICELGGRAAANIEVPGAVANALDPHDFDLLINCAGGTEVDRCERYPHWAQQVNAASVAEMAAACAAKGARLIHISSDYVFRGDHDRPYTEDDAPDPISEYGRAKLAGERAALDADAANLVVRVSWLFADGRPCFPDWAIRRAMSQDPLRIVSDKISSPTYARDFAKLIRPLLFGECAVGGVLHLPNAGAASWLEFGQHALDCAAAAGIPLHTRHAEGIPLSEMTQFTAQRPLYSALCTAKFERLTGIKPRSWRQAVAAFVERYAQRLRAAA